MLCVHNSPIIFSLLFSVFALCCDAELLLVIQTLKNAFWPSLHAPLALTSGLALSPGIPITIFPSIGWKEGSGWCTRLTRIVDSFLCLNVNFLIDSIFSFSKIKHRLLSFLNIWFHHNHKKRIACKHGPS